MSGAVHPMRALTILAVTGLLLLPGAVLAAPLFPPPAHFDPGRIPHFAPRNGNNTTNQTDTVPPVIVILGPRDLAEVKDTGLTVQGTASDESGIRLVTVRLNGADPVAAQGNTSWSLRLKLREGRNTLSISAEDLAGNAASQSISVIYKTEPPGSGGVILAVAVLVLLVVLIALASLRGSKKAENGNGEGDGQGAEPLTRKEEDAEKGQIAALDDFDKKKMATPRRRRKDEEE